MNWKSDLQAEPEIRLNIKKSAGKKRKTQINATKAEAESVRRKRKIKPEDIPHIFRPGMEILVQVIKAPISTKGARITTDITIPGRYLVLMPYHQHRGLSTRIESAPERERLRKIISELDLPEGMGVICRTVGEGRKAAFFKRDLKILLDYWDSIEDKISRCQSPVCVYQEPNLIERTARAISITKSIGIINFDERSIPFCTPRAMTTCVSKAKSTV